MNPTYSIVIGTFQHCYDLLKPCIDALIINTDLSNTEIIVVANGCTDNTRDVIESYNHQNIHLLWYDKPLGYSKANNEGIKIAKGEYIILLNNDAFILNHWQKHRWIECLREPFKNPYRNVGITGPLMGWSDPANHEFLIFFCVMIKREVFDKIGLLDESFGKGGGEDTAFSLEAIKAGYEIIEVDKKVWNDQAMLYTGSFPIYHRGEGTVHDKSLVPDWDDVFESNSKLLMQRYGKVNPTVLKKYSEEIYNDVIKNNCYELSHDKVKNRNVIDIGANIGCFSVFSSYLGAKKIYAIEPVKSTFEILEKNINDSGADNIIAFHNAMGIKSGDILKISVKENAGHNSAYNITDTYDECETISLKDILHKIDDDNIILKLDCEGAEYDILMNASKDEMKKINDIIIEIHGDLHPEYKGFDIIEEKINSFGFEKVKDNQVFVWNYNNGILISCVPLPHKVEIWKRNI